MKRDSVLEPRSEKRPVSTEFLVLKTIVLFVLWMMLSGRFDVVHLGLGFILSFLVAWINSGHSPFVLRFHIWWKILRYLPWLFSRILLSSWHVATLILHPRLPIQPKFIRYETRLTSTPALVLLGNSITLTPGTITAEVKGQTLVIHAMDEVSGEDVTSGRMEARIADVFGEGDRAP